MASGIVRDGFPSVCMGVVTVCSVVATRAMSMFMPAGLSVSLGTFGPIHFFLLKVLTPNPSMRGGRASGRQRKAHDRLVGMPHTSLEPAGNSQLNVIQYTASSSSGLPKEHRYCEASRLYGQRPAAPTIKSAAHAHKKFLESRVRSSG